MSDKMRNFRLPDDVWVRVEDVCHGYGLVSTTGSTKGRPSISVLLRAIADGSFLVIPKLDEKVEGNVLERTYVAPVQNTATFDFKPEDVEEEDGPQYVPFDNL
jgi:hypothetical protein